MKNKKGFTLVELLAVLVILGILMGLAVPAITRLIGDNKTKSYINDAKKLIARAETVVNSKNTVIEKPDPNDCIVFSLGYLDDGSFDSSPYKDKEGEYMQDASFVVLKNNGGIYEYSAILVEKFNGSSYRGVKMSTLDQLSESGYKSRVVNIKKNDYGYAIGTSDISSFEIDSLTVSDLNKFYEDVTNYISNDGDIVDYYRYEDESSTSGSSSGSYQKLKTKINDIQILSYDKNNKKYLNVTSNITAGSLNNIWVCTVVSASNPNSETDGAYNKSLTYNKCSESNGILKEVIGTSKEGNNVDVKDIDVTNIGSDDIWVHVYVGKSHGSDGWEDVSNTIRQKRKYTLNADLPPVIEKFAVDKNYIYLNVSDDKVKKEDLLVCIVDDDSANTKNCNNYQKYSAYGFDGNKISHNYEQNGYESRHVHVFVKDSQNGSPVDAHSVYKKNKKPEIKEFSISPATEKVEYEGVTYSNNTIRTELYLEVEDDSYSNQLSVCFNDKNNCPCKYSDFDSGNHYPYTFAGEELDGSAKELTIFVCDEKGECASKTANYTLYTKPKLNKPFKVVSDDGFHSNKVRIELEDGFDVIANITNGKENMNISYCIKNITLGNEKCIATKLGDFKEKFNGNNPYFELPNADYSKSMNYRISLKTYDPVIGKDVELGSYNYSLYEMCSKKRILYSYKLQDQYYAYSSTGVINEDITTDRCQGKCYYDSNGPKAYYFKSLVAEYDIYLKNEDGTAITCVEPQEGNGTLLKYGCEFYKCIGNTDDVRYNVIGNTEMKLSENEYWTEGYTNGNGEFKVYSCTTFYQLYKVTVKEDHAIAQPYDGCHVGLCGAIYNSNPADFKYGSNAGKNPYYQIEDAEIFDDLDEPFIRIDDSKADFDKTQCSS